MPVAAPPHPPIAPPPLPPPPVALGRRQPVPIERKVNCTAAWTLIGVLCAFKILTIGLILVLAQASNQAVTLLVVTNWIWLIPLGLVLSMIPFGLYYRLVRARARRRQLQYAEWNVAC